MNTSCHNCLNDRCLIKRNNKGALMNAFVEKKTTLQCKKGQHFIVEGAPVHGLYFVREGKVKVAKTGINGREQIVRFAAAGETIGHRGFGVGQFYQISAVSLENTTLCNFSNEVMVEMLHTVPGLTYELMLFYAEELNKSETKVKKFAQMTVREKVIDALLYMNRKFGQTHNYLNIRLSRKEIADFAGTTEEQVIRTISSLKKEGLLRSEGKELGIVDVKLLSKEIADYNYFIDS